MASHNANVRFHGNSIRSEMPKYVQRQSEYAVPGKSYRKGINEALWPHSPNKRVSACWIGSKASSGVQTLGSGLVRLILGITFELPHIHTNSTIQATRISPVITSVAPLVLVIEGTEGKTEPEYEDRLITFDSSIVD
jgi:hypothetical protein